MLRPRELGGSRWPLALFPARTPTLPPATHTNSYALGGQDVLLVEPASPYDDEQREWIAWARGLASLGRRLVAIVATHHHADHVGGAEVIARELGVPIWAHALTTARLPDGARARVSRSLSDGDDLRLEGPRPQCWRVLFTPGHAPGHVCLFERESGALVVGDMVASVGTILVAPGEGDMARYIVELRRLASLGARVALPAHGEPIDEPVQVFERYVAHRLAREAKVLAALRTFGGAGADAATLVPIAYDDTPPHLWPIAKLSLEAHVEKLVAEGSVEPFARGEALAWRALAPAGTV